MEIEKRCGGFVAVDEVTEHKQNLRWARILVQYKEDVPACVHIGLGNKIFAIPIWVESAALVFHED